MRFRIGADPAKKVLVWMACRNSHSNEIGFYSAVPPAWDIRSEFLFLPERQTDGVCPSPTLAVGSWLLLRNWMSLVSLSEALA